jgi:tetratricopeptide (TPR) repeat protein
MAKRSRVLLDDVPSYIVPTKADPGSEQKWPIGGVVATVVWLAYVLVAFFFFGPSQFALVQRLLGSGCALLASVVFLQYTKRKAPSEALLLRHQMALRSDFGKQLLAQQMPKPSKTVKLPLLGEVRVRTIGGFAVFGVVLGWWLTPFAPVRVRERPYEDLTVPMGEEIAAAVLVTPDARMPLVQPPLLSSQAKVRAAPIRDDANAYWLGLKAVSEGRYESARVAFLSNEVSAKADPGQVFLARAQNEMFAGMFIDAAKLYDSAIREHCDRPLVLIQDAVAWLQAGSLKNAEAAMTRAMQACEGLPEDDRVGGLAANLQAVVLTCRGRQLDQAESACFKARQVFEKCENGVPLLATTFNNLAVLNLIRSNFPVATNLLEDASNRWTQVLGQQSLYVAACRNNQAALQTALADYAKAAESLASVQAIHESQLVQGHPLTGFRLLTQAMLQEAKGQYADAQKSAEESMAVLQQAFGRRHLTNLPPMNLLTKILFDLGQYEQAERYADAAVAFSKAALGPQSPSYADALGQQGVVQLAQKRFGGVEPACKQALGIYRQALGREHAGVADVTETLGQLEISREQFDAARPHLEQSRKIRENLFGERHPSIAMVLGDLALLENSPNTLSRGVTLFKQAIEMEEHFFGDGCPELAHLYYGYATLLAGQARYSEAATVLKKAVEIHEKSLPATHPELPVILEAYAAVLRKTTPPDAAQATAIEARVKQLRGSAH